VRRHKRSKKKNEQDKLETKAPKLTVLKSVFFNLFEVAEPKMASKNFAEPKWPSKNLHGTPIF
jgi:hypothetical protein